MCAHGCAVNSACMRVRLSQPQQNTCPAQHAPLFPGAALVGLGCGCRSSGPRTARPRSTYCTPSTSATEAQRWWAVSSASKRWRRRRNSSGACKAVHRGSCRMAQRCDRKHSRFSRQSHQLLRLNRCAVVFSFAHRHRERGGGGEGGREGQGEERDEKRER